MTFFNEQKEQSEIKSQIVAKYFMAWANVILGAQGKRGKTRKIAYIDLFAGPGRYEDGAASTPLKILDMAIKEPKLRDTLVTVFNDKEPDHTSKLLEEIEKLPGIETLKYRPDLHTEEIGSKVVEEFEESSLIPTLMFVDPWGYKGLSLRLINAVLQNWACECIFFFNYNRINMGINNASVKHHIDALFGEERGKRVRSMIDGLTPDDRELMLVEQVCEALEELGGKYVLPFRFRNEKGTRTKHHLIFVSKNQVGYTIMKDVMARESSSEEQGVATFEYNPADEKFPRLFDLNQPLDELGEMLLTTFAGRSITMADIFIEHNYGYPYRYIKKNYKQVLIQLEESGKIVGTPPISKRRKQTCGENTVLTFPSAKGK